MNGIKHKGVTLFLGRIPGRKSLCFYFERDGNLYPVAYVREDVERIATDLWKQFIGESKPDVEQVA